MKNVLFRDRAKAIGWWFLPLAVLGIAGAGFDTLFGGLSRDGRLIVVGMFWSIGGLYWLALTARLLRWLFRKPCGTPIIAAMLSVCLITVSTLDAQSQEKINPPPKDAPPNVTMLEGAAAAAIVALAAYSIYRIGCSVFRKATTVGGGYTNRLNKFDPFPDDDPVANRRTNSKPRVAINNFLGHGPLPGTSAEKSFVLTFRAGEPALKLTEAKPSECVTLEEWLVREDVPNALPDDSGSPGALAVIQPLGDRTFHIAPPDWPDLVSVDVERTDTISANSQWERVVKFIVQRGAPIALQDAPDPHVSSFYRVSICQ